MELSIINPINRILAFLSITITRRVMILFHEKLKYLREHQELSQKEICKRLGLPTSTYCRYESGETQPNLITLKLIANFFDVTVDYLLDNQILTDNELVESDTVAGLIGLNPNLTGVYEQLKTSWH